MSSINALSDCITPLQTAIVFNPTRPEYYRADDAKAPKTDKPAVTVTLSPEAQASLKS